jgi:transcriptional regulator with XRE-family HTH domain
MSTFGDILKMDRERKGLSQDALAKLLGVSQQAVANWEAGTSLPAKHRREKLVEALGRDALIAQYKPPYEFLPAEDSAEDGEPKLLRAEVDKTPQPAPTPQPPQTPRAPGPVARTLREIQERRAKMIADVKAALPDNLRTNIGKKRNFGQIEREYEYVSAGVVARIVSLPHGVAPLTSWVAVPILRLAMAVDPPMAMPSVNCVLFLLTPENPAVVRRRMESFIQDAGILSVSVEIVESAEQIAQAIAGLEALYASEVEKFNEWFNEVVREAEDEAVSRPDISWEEIEALPSVAPVSKQKPPDEDLF